MDRTGSNLTLAALLLAVGYIVGQAVTPHAVDAGVAKGVREDQIVTTRDDSSGNLTVWEFAGSGVVRATSYELWNDNGQPRILVNAYAPTSQGPGGR